MSSSEAKSEHWLITQWRGGLTSEQLHRANQDIVQGLRSWTLWETLGLQDIRQRYRRSVIGPFWITISMGIMVGALGLLYGTIFQQPLDVYLPYLTAGFVVWGLVSLLILEGTNVFIEAEGLIRQLPTPYSVHVYRVVWRNALVFAHNIWIFVIVMLWLGKNPGWVALWAVPGVAILLLNGVWMGIFFGLLSARFRDIPQIVASVVQVIFFLTPIIWMPKMMPDRSWMLDLNPFYHLVAIVRQPLLGEVPSLENWIVVLGITIVGSSLTLLFYTIYRWRIAYWV